jgi:hypothetical protein
MPADRAHVGMGRRRNHENEKLAPDDRNRSLERAIDRDAQMEAADADRLLSDSSEGEVTDRNVERER